MNVCIKPSYQKMVILVTDGSDNLEEMKALFALNGIKTRILPIKRFEEGLKGGVDLIIYDTYNLSPGDVKNIHLAKEADIPILLISAYPEKWAMEEISRLWRHNLIKDYLIRPVEVERLVAHLPSASPVRVSNQPEGMMHESE